MAKNISWGNYALVDDIEYRFEDQDDWYWIIKPVTSGMELKYSKFLNHNRIKRNPDGTIVELPAVWTEIAHRQISLTFGGTNIPMGDDPKKHILEDNANIRQIEGMLGIMPPDMVSELWRAVGKSYPFWGPADNPLTDDLEEEIEEELEGIPEEEVEGKEEQSD